MNRKSIWALLHFLGIATVLVSLLSGLRIAVLEYPVILRFNFLLPQGDMHSLHAYSALLLTGITGIYVWYLYKKVFANLKQFNRSQFKGAYHWGLACLLRGVLPTLIISGWLLYSEHAWLDIASIKKIHFAAALAMLIYVLFHTIGYFIQLGKPFLFPVFRPLFRLNKQMWLIISLSSLFFTLSSYYWFQNHNHLLLLSRIEPDIYIKIDGQTNELAWQSTESITVHTHSGANFQDGTTPISIRAMQNGDDAYFHFRWQDNTQSLSHLPLLKTENGWQVQQDGFHNFDEKTFYEDKFAVILSDHCEMNAAGTAHLGPKPLENKPKHWTGKGYHYRERGLVDLWQWKAVRTNNMFLMDDNYIGEPTEPRYAERRYTAGYHQDAKESGAYKMNWQWYYPNQIIPKRLPIDQEQMSQYQYPNVKHDIADLSSSWIIPWFDSTPYHPENDQYPVGTQMPSILYSSNRFEGDRAHVKAYAKWHNGFWSLEVLRKLNTRSDKDVIIQHGTCIWVAAFDHSQIAHTRHTRPIKLLFHE